MLQPTKIKRPASSPELSETTGAAIVKTLEDDDSATEIARDLRVARSTVHGTKMRFEERKDMTPKPRSGHPSELGEQTTRCTLAEERGSTQLGYYCSRSTMSRITRQDDQKDTR
ncbi:hypothetical protein N7463_001490 [Penicillium fimorum]|uniref:Uncharacterized protein n=1 Tax=Penicillium fimorum TaxID=1882269 RepID=A0A9X0CCY6_9EURO|nr:hypothetical protein N7463_001490 [Penicillium fimorum]